MNIKQALLFFFALLACVLAADAIPNDKANTLYDLRASLKDDYQQREQALKEVMNDYDEVHQQIQEAIDKNDFLSGLLYIQGPNYTFNLAWILKEVNQQYARYKKACDDYNDFFDELDVETERYERLLASLQKRKVEPALEPCLDSCVFYASGILDYYQNLRDTLSVNRRFYEEAVEQLKETNDYVETRFASLEDIIFKNGQGSWSRILSDPDHFKEEMKNDIKKQYSISDMQRLLEIVNSEDEDWDPMELTDRGENTLLLYVGILFAIGLLIFCLFGMLVVFVFARIFKFARSLTRAQKMIASLLLGTLLFLVHLVFTNPSDVFIQASVQMYRSYFWLMIAIMASLLIRVKPERLKYSARLYLPTILMVLIVIICRVSFLPDKLLTYILGIVLVFFSILQLIACLCFARRADRVDAWLGWISLVVSIIALVVAYLGYTFIALLVLVCWYIQLAVILTLTCLVHLIRIYRSKRVKARIEKYQPRLAAITGLDKNAVQFGFTWFYDLLVGVILPILALLSVPFCLHLSLDVFDFDKIFKTIWSQPFIHLVDKDGADVLVISFKSIIRLVSLFFIFRYLNKVIHAFWQRFRYKSFLRQHHRRKVRDNELNLSLGNSIISVLVWLVYACIVVIVFHIPVGSLTLIAGGLSAGIGLALKDTINNFIYGIQLMSGRLRVGDIIQCDGVRGKVTDINYQNTQLKVDDSILVFTNEALFSKNFRNLSRGSAYETVKIPVTVSYGTDIEKVRKLLIDASRVLRTKDKFDRDIVDPKKGIRVDIEDFGDSGIDLCVKQGVLLEEKTAYLRRARELMYKTLMDNGVDIPFPQYDIHLVKDNEQ